MSSPTYGGFFESSDLTDAEVDAIEAIHVPVADDLRGLVDLAIRSEVGEAAVAEARLHLAAAADLLGAQTRPGPAGVSHNESGRSWQWGNAVVGQRNAVAPPMKVERHEDGSTSARLVLGNAYEGPPSMVHGGVSALLLDHLMGVTASSMTKLTMTGTLTLRYTRPLLARRGLARGPDHRGHRPQGHRHRRDRRRRRCCGRGGGVVHRAELVGGGPAGVGRGPCRSRRKRLAAVSTGVAIGQYGATGRRVRVDTRQCQAGESAWRA